MKKSVPEYPNYEITDEGFVFNRATGRKLGEDTTNRGYKRITVCKAGRTKRFTVHRLVALLFIHNPGNLPTVNHKDGDKSNNSVGNLEWMSQEENQKHAVENDLCPKGSENGNSKWGEALVHRVCSLIEVGWVRGDVLKVTGITKASFDDIRRRRTWRHISSNYEW